MKDALLAANNVLRAADKVLDSVDRMAAAMQAYTRDDNEQAALGELRERIARNRKR
jgi:hypothetical protein